MFLSTAILLINLKNLNYKITSYLFDALNATVIKVTGNRNEVNSTKQK